METKPWYVSKTLWVNVIAMIAMLVQTKVGFVIDAETQAALLIVINLVLRIITKTPISWTNSG